jgi:hypothetical protein
VRLCVEWRRDVAIVRVICVSATPVCCKAYEDFRTHTQDPSPTQSWFCDDQSNKLR